MLNMSLRTLLNAGMLPEAQGLFDKHARIADIISYNTLLKGYGPKGLGESNEVVKRLQAAGLEPNVITYNTLLDIAAKTQQTQVWSILDEMVERGLNPDKYSCSILVKSLQGIRHGDSRKT